MRRPTAFLLMLPLLAGLGCGSSDGPGADALGPDDPQYGPPAGSDAQPTDAEPGEAPLGDPAQPPEQAGVPTGAGGNATSEDEPGAFRLAPPRDLDAQPDPAPADPS